MFNHIKKIGLVSIIALTITVTTPAQQLGVGSSNDLDVGATVPVQQMDGAAKGERGVVLQPLPGPGGRDGGRPVLVSNSNLVPGTPYALFIGTGPNSPVLLLDAGIVPDMGKLVLKMDVALLRDSVMRTYFRNGDTTIICPKGPGLIKPSTELALYVTDQGTALLVLDSVSNGDQGLGASANGVAKGAAGNGGANTSESLLPAPGNYISNGTGRSVIWGVYLQGKGGGDPIQAGPIWWWGWTYRLVWFTSDTSRGIGWALHGAP